jgi:hypothetical protein
MTIQVTLTFGTPGEAAAAILLLAAGVAPAASPASKPAETAAPTATTPPATPEAKTSAPVASATKATAGKAKPPAASPAPAPAETNASLAGKSYPETGIGDLINGYLRKDAVKNRPTLVAALAALGGAKSGLEIKPEYYDAAYAAFKALNDGADPTAVLAGLSGDESMG